MATLISPKSWRDKSDFGIAPIFNAAWVINAPWAHPIWTQYALFLYDLTTPSDKGETVFLKEGMTHEMILYALDPVVLILPHKTLIEQGFKYLTPANCGYQFKAESNEAAVERIRKIIDKVDSRAISPDTDYRGMWDELFKDGASLLKKSDTGIVLAIMADTNSPVNKTKH
jgi:hypothetical protein